MHEATMGLRGMMSRSLIQLWYLLPESEPLKENGLNPESIEFNAALKDKLNDMSEGSFLELYNRTIRKFYEL